MLSGIAIADSGLEGGLGAVGGMVSHLVLTLNVALVAVPALGTECAFRVVAVPIAFVITNFRAFGGFAFLAMQDCGWVTILVAGIAPPAIDASSAFTTCCDLTANDCSCRCSGFTGFFVTDRRRFICTMCENLTIYLVAARFITSVIPPTLLAILVTVQLQFC